MHTLQVDILNGLASSLTAVRLLLVMCYDNKMVKLPFNLIILPLIKP